MPAIVLGFGCMLLVLDELLALAEFDLSTLSTSIHALAVSNMQQDNCKQKSGGGGGGDPVQAAASRLAN